MKQCHWEVTLNYWIELWMFLIKCGHMIMAVKDIMNLE